LHLGQFLLSCACSLVHVVWKFVPQQEASTKPSWMNSRHIAQLGSIGRSAEEVVSPSIKLEVVSLSKLEVVSLSKLEVVSLSKLEVVSLSKLEGRSESIVVQLPTGLGRSRSKGSWSISSRSLVELMLLVWCSCRQARQAW
jgi:hypothetical protein